MSMKKNIITNCEKSTLLIEKRQLSSLGLIDRLYIKIHLASCEECRTYQKQSAVINHMADRIFKDTPISLKLDEDFKRNMQFKINEIIDKK